VCSTGPFAAASTACDASEVERRRHGHRHGGGTQPATHAARHNARRPEFLGASQVAQLEKILEGIPPDFLPEFEEAATELIGAFKDSAAGARSDDSDEGEEGACGGAAARAPTEGGREKKRRKKADKQDPFKQMKDIQHWLRLKVPPEAVVESEHIVYGHPGTDFADYSAQNTQSVDGFLYEEDDVDEMCEQGKLARSYCAKCGSREVKDLNFISHSLSIRELEFIFTTALPTAKCALDKGLLVDVGSRLGAVLYAACIFGQATNVTGIEMNADLCKVQEETIKVFGLQAAARVVCDDVRKQLELVGKAKVVVLHNVFQFFLEKKEAADAWAALFGALAPGTTLVTCPPMEEQLSSSCAVKQGTAFMKRLQPIELEYPVGEIGDEYADEHGDLFSNIRVYTIAPK